MAYAAGGRPARVLGVVGGRGSRFYFSLPILSDLPTQDAGALTRRPHETVVLLTEQADAADDLKQYLEGRGFEVEVGHQILRAKKVILATGMKDLQPPIENYESLRKKGLLGYCPICDGFDHSKDRIGLLVNGSHGLKKISFIAKFSPDLHIIPTKELKLSSHYISTIKKVGAHFHAGQLESLQSQTKPRGLTVKMKNRKPFFVKFAYVALGAVVNASAIQFIKLVRRSKDGHFITDAHQQTSVPGLFAVGDCVHTLSQVSVAVGQAAIAATQVHNDLGF